MYYLVLDIGGSAIKYAVMDENINIYERGSIATPMDNMEHLLETIEKLHRDADQNYPIEAVAVSMPGMIDSQRGYCFSGGSLLYIENVSLAEMISERIGKKVTIENDGKSAALAEVWKGSLQYCNDGIVMVLGTGVAGGIIIDRKIRRGRHFSAGEFSFILADVRSDNDLNDYFGFTNGSIGLRRLVSERTGINVRDLNGKNIFQMANEGDERVLDALDKFTWYLAAMIHNMQMCFDPERIAIGGGISVQPLLLEYVKKNLEKLYQGLPFEVPHAEVVLCEYFNDSNLIGALYNYFTQTGIIKETRIGE